MRKRDAKGKCRDADWLKKKSWSDAIGAKSGDASKKRMVGASKPIGHGKERAP